MMPHLADQPWIGLGYHSELQVFTCGFILSCDGSILIKYFILAAAFCLLLLILCFERMYRYRLLCLLSSLEEGNMPINVYFKISHLDVPSFFPAAVVWAQLFGCLFCCTIKTPFFNYSYLQAQSCSQV